VHCLFRGMGDACGGARVNGEVPFLWGQTNLKSTRFLGTHSLWKNSYKGFYTFSGFLAFRCFSVFQRSGELGEEFADIYI